MAGLGWGPNSSVPPRTGIGEGFVAGHTILRGEQGLGHSALRSKGQDQQWGRRGAGRHVWVTVCLPHTRTRMWLLEREEAGRPVVDCWAQVRVPTVAWPNPLAAYFSG